MVKLTELKLAINLKANRFQEDFRIFITRRKKRNNEWFIIQLHFVEYK